MKDGTMRKFCKSDLVQQFEKEVSPIKTHRLSYRESTVNKLSALFFTFVDSKESCSSLVACMPRRALVLANNRDDVTSDNIIHIL
jgi:hypothetical protein